jgi:hypothetical protein
MKINNPLEVINRLSGLAGLEAQPGLNVARRQRTVQIVVAAIQKPSAWKRKVEDFPEQSYNAAILFLPPGVDLVAAKCSLNRTFFSQKTLIVSMSGLIDTAPL